MTAQEALQKKVWAVVGATPKPEKFGYKVYTVLKKNGYEVYPIHPKATEIDGSPVYHSVLDLPVVPDVVDLVVGEEPGLKAVAECAEKGVKTIWFQPGADTPCVLEAAKNAGINVIQDCVLVRL